MGSGRHTEEGYTSGQLCAVMEVSVQKEELLVHQFPGMETSSSQHNHSHSVHRPEKTTVDISSLVSPSYCAYLRLLLLQSIYLLCPLVHGHELFRAFPDVLLLRPQSHEGEGSSWSSDVHNESPVAPDGGWLRHQLPCIP